MVVPRTQPTTKRPSSKSAKALPKSVVPSLLRRFMCRYPGCLNRRGFSRSADLKRHQETHIGGPDDKKHKCTTCSFRAHQKSNLEAHLLTHSPGSHFDCPHCDKSYRSRSTRTRHVQQQHNVVASHTDEYYLARGLSLPASAPTRRAKAAKKDLRKRGIRKAGSPPSRSASVYSAGASSSSSWETVTSSPSSPGFGTLDFGADPVDALTKETARLSVAPKPVTTPASLEPQTEAAPMVFDFLNVNASEDANPFTEQGWNEKVFEDLQHAIGLRMPSVAEPAQTGAMYGDNSIAPTNFSGGFEYGFGGLDLQGPFMGTDAATNTFPNVNMNVDFQAWAQQPKAQVQQFPQQNQQQVAVSPFDAAPFYFQMGAEQLPAYVEANYGLPAYNELVYNDNSSNDGNNFRFGFGNGFGTQQAPQVPSLMPSGFELQQGVFGGL
ncbi:hypothetical protein DENSPDRAFT_676 [Dentipellis sp. KUC8613]|nr:hypothetical protein DENSPDRAFT_676 [Dentipellis sp. KUC8613]